MVGRFAAEPGIEFAADGQHRRERPVERQRVEPQAAQAGKPRVHGLKL